MLYLIVAFILVIPFSYMLARVMPAEDTFEYGLAAVEGIFAAAIWPLTLLMVIIVFCIKGLEKLRKGSRLQVSWRKK